MATLADGSLTFSGAWNDASDLARMDELQKISDNLPEGEIVGAILQFPYADGYAIYRVIADEPLTVQHVAFGDAWSVDRMMIKGMDREDVLDHLARRKRLQALFASR